MRAVRRAVRCRLRAGGGVRAVGARAHSARRCCGRFTTFTGRRAPGRSSTRSRWTGPAGGRAHAHHNPMEPFGGERAGLYRPRVPSGSRAVSRTRSSTSSSPGCRSHRDRALVAFYVSTGARASELLSATLAGRRPGAAADHGDPQGNAGAAAAAGFHGRVRVAAALPGGDGWPDPGGAAAAAVVDAAPPVPAAVLSRRAPHVRAGHDQAGASATLHSLRHTAAYRMAEDPALPLTDVQLVLGHAHLTTTQLYLTPRKEEVIRRVLAHHAEQTRQAAARARPARRPGTGQRRWMCCSGTAHRDHRGQRIRVGGADGADGPPGSAGAFPGPARAGGLAGDGAVRGQVQDRPDRPCAVCRWRTASDLAEAPPAAAG